METSTGKARKVFLLIFFTGFGQKLLLIITVIRNHEVAFWGRRK